MHGNRLLNVHGLTLYGLVALSFFLYLLPDHIKWSLYLHLDQPETFRFWQLFSAHFMHLSWQHLMGNGIGIAIVQQIYGRSFRRLSWLWVAALLTLFVSVGLIWLSVELRWYAGLSGVVVGLACYGVLVDTHYRIIFNALFVAALVIYSTFFWIQGEVSEGLGLIPVASLSHILGIIAGAIMGGIVRLRTELGKQT